MSKTTPKTTLYFTIHNSYEIFQHKDRITKAEFILITQSFNYLLFEHMLRDGTMYKLPFKSGMLGVFKYKTPKNMKDWAFGNVHGVEKTLTNNHSGNLMAKIKNYTTYPYSDLPPELCNFFKLKAARMHNRRLATYIKQHNTINSYENLDDY